MIIYMKNGAIITVGDKLMTIKRNGMGDFVGLSWEHDPGQPGLYYVDFSEIVAVVDNVPQDAPRDSNAKE